MSIISKINSVKTTNTSGFTNPDLQKSSEQVLNKGSQTSTQQSTSISLFRKKLDPLVLSSDEISFQLGLNKQTVVFPYQHLDTPVSSTPGSRSPNTPQEENTPLLSPIDPIKRSSSQSSAFQYES